MSWVWRGRASRSLTSAVAGGASGVADGRSCPDSREELEKRERSRDQTQQAGPKRAAVAHGWNSLSRRFSRRRPTVGPVDVEKATAIDQGADRRGRRIPASERSLPKSYG